MDIKKYAFKAKEFLYNEWLFFLSLIIFFATSIYLKRVPQISKDEMEVLFILTMFFITIKGLENSGFLTYLAAKMERGSFLHIKLILLTFFISSFITNDVALVTVVPLTLALNIKNKDLLVILEAITANGAELFPFGSPQNLYIYWHYNLSFLEFIKTMAPFVAAMFVFVMTAATIIPFKVYEKRTLSVHIKKREVYPYLFFFILIVMTIIKIVPLYTAFVVFFYSLLLNREALKIDYMLLLIFLLFFGIADNLSTIFSQVLNHPHHIFFLSLLLSQLMSNVPATLLLAEFTQEWKALLWGVNVGGYGLLWGSLASLIAYRLYTGKFGDRGRFLAKFLLLNFLALFVGVAAYYY